MSESLKEDGEGEEEEEEVEDSGCVGDDPEDSPPFRCWPISRGKPCSSIK